MPPGAAPGKAPYGAPMPGGFPGGPMPGAPPQPGMLQQPGAPPAANGFGPPRPMGGPPMPGAAPPGAPRPMGGAPPGGAPLHPPQQQQQQQQQQHLAAGMQGMSLGPQVSSGVTALEGADTQALAPSSEAQLSCQNARPHWGPVPGPVWWRWWCAGQPWGTREHAIAACRAPGLRLPWV
jgi:hypothetical protein